jgi:hypothetical protein
METPEAMAIGLVKKDEQLLIETVNGAKIRHQRTLLQRYALVAGVPELFTIQ